MIINEGGCLPTEAYKRKIVMVLDSAAMNRIRFIEDDGLRANPSICLINSEDCMNDSLIKHFAEPGAVLIQNPYDNNLYDYAEKAIYNFSLAKHTIVSELFQKLGCEELEITQVDVETEKQTYEIAVKAGTPVASGNFKSINVNEQSLCRQVGIYEKYAGCNARIDDAKKLLQDKGLDNDCILYSLIERRKDIQNPLKEHTLKVTLNNEAKRSLELLANLKITKIQLPISFDFKNTSEIKKEYRVTYRAVF